MLKLLRFPMLLAALAGPAAAAVTAGNLIAFYDFNGDTVDESGNGANGTLNNGAAISADGAGYSSMVGDSALDVGASGGKCIPTF